MASLEYVRLAQSLPPRLLRFFARYPPPAISSTSRTISLSPSTSSPNPNDDQVETNIPSLPYQNPFQKKQHPVTGRWHDAKFSLRHQADICKMARQYGVEEHLPPSSKSSDARLQRRTEEGVRVKGTGIGQRVKGHLYERTMKQRLNKRRQAMLDMPGLVQKWRQVSQIQRRDR